MVQNAEDLLAALERPAPLTKSYDAHADLGYFLYVEVNRRLLNFLSAFRMYLDHTDRRPSRSKRDEVRETWKELCSYAFDNSFAYRLFYKLRNFTQHKTIPLGSMTHSGQATKGGEQYEWIAAIESKSLLAEDRKVWGSVREELSDAPDQLALQPLVRELLHEIKRNAKLLRRAEFPDPLHHGQLLMGLLKPAFDQGFVPRIARVDGDGEADADGEVNLSLVIEEFPVKRLEHIGLLQAIPRIR